MKLVFSEHVSDYGNYIFPYAVWAFPEQGEKPHQLFNAGFLPSSLNLDRFYLCRQVRVDLKQFKPSTENRRVLRKGDGIQLKRVPRAQFDYTTARRTFCRRYADIKFGKDTMSYQRLDNLFDSPLVSHVLVFTDTRADAEVGLAMVYCDRKELAFYYYAFYDLDYFQRNLGMFMMTSAVAHFAKEGTRHIYLGSCYSTNARYKTQFTGAEFFNGFRWSTDQKELKHLLGRDVPGAKPHAVADEDFIRLFYNSDLGSVTKASSFKVELG